MKHVLLLTNLAKDTDGRLTRQVIDLLASHGTAVHMDPRVADLLPPHASVIPDFGTAADKMACILVIGGDGSVLDAVEHAIRLDAPMLGINLGRLGYLSEVEPDHLELLERLYTGEYTFGQRMTLGITHTDAEGNTLPIRRVALNEVTVTHNSFFGIAEMTLIDPSGERIAYRSDGLILATPSGSTAYSLSAGGPIVDCGVPCICVTPICPHTLFRQSVIFPASSALQIKNTGDRRNTLYVCLDGRSVTTLAPGESITVRASSHPINMITFGTHSAFSTLKRKLERLEMGDTV